MDSFILNTYKNMKNKNYFIENKKLTYDIFKFQAQIGT